LIPPTIEIYENEPLQLRHEFYSQNYKLPTEGFTEALYKAKIINTICALIRPKVLQEYAKEMPPLPPYVDAGLMDRAIASHNEILKSFTTEFIVIGASRHGKDRKEKTILEIVIEYDYDEHVNSRFSLVIRTDLPDPETLSVISDRFVGKEFRTVVFRNRLSAGRSTVSYESLNPERAALLPNVFIISRIIYEMLNKGFDKWVVTYNVYDPEQDAELVIDSFRI